MYVVLAEGNRLMNERVPHHPGQCRVCLDILKHRRLGRIQACIPSGVRSDRMNRELQGHGLGVMVIHV